MKHYDHTHATVAEVRACDTRRTEAVARLTRAHTSSAILANISGGRLEYRPITPQAAQRQDAKYARMNRTPRRTTAVASRAAAGSAAPGYVTRPATDRAKGYARDLINDRDTNLISLRASEVMMDLLAGNLVAADEISLLIDDLKAAPRKDRNEAPAPVRPTRQDGPSLRDLAAPLADKGYYALRTPGSADEIHYYRITRSEKGYVKVQEQASDELYPVDYRRSLDVVRRIAEDAEAAAHLYADTLERCYRCGRTLTDETSRALRIGPDCRTK